MLFVRGQCVVIFDRVSGKSRGFGFVTFVVPESAVAALASPNPLLDGRRININLVRCKISTTLCLGAVRGLVLTIPCMLVPPLPCGHFSSAFHAVHRQPWVPRRREEEAVSIFQDPAFLTGRWWTHGTSSCL